MAGQILGDRYEVEKQLGKQFGRWTLLARDLVHDQAVILKLIFIDDELRSDDLKLFNREVETLRTIHHPATPKYLGYFEIELPKDGKALALVQSYIDGVSIDKYLQRGRRFTEKEAKQIGKSVLKILTYLHNHEPPIIHRDIKPSNILLSNQTHLKSTQVCLVDFGSVKSVTSAHPGVSFTVVGTGGYTPPEQIGGRAVKGSDLYSLGMTLVALITGEAPEDFPRRRGNLDASQIDDLSPSFADWLTRMTDTDLRQRFNTADDALDELRQLMRSPQQA